jgi:protein O-mannosyl-transferase
MGKKISRNNINKFAALALIIMLTTVVYANSLKATFVLEDSGVIAGNAFIKSWKNFPLIFTRAYLTPFINANRIVEHSVGSQETSYRPVVTLSYFIDYSFWKLNPFGYHLTNLLLHVFNAILVYFFAFLITGGSQIALFSALLFALHPVNTEVVNVISFREDLLSFSFFIWSLILYLKLDSYRGRKKSLVYISSLGLFALALFSKEMAASLPLVILLYEVIFNPRDDSRKPFLKFKFRYLGYFSVLFFYFWVRFFLMRNLTEPPVAYPGGNFFTGIATMFKVTVVYLKSILLPINIHYVLSGDPHLVGRTLFEPGVLFSMALILFVFTLAIKIRRSFKIAAFSIFWFFITLLPVANIWPIENYIAMRYLYIPALGFSLLLASISNIWQKSARVVLAAVLLFYCGFAVMRNNVWKNDTSLWLDMVSQYPLSPLVHYNLGVYYAKAAATDRAIASLKKAIGLKPDYYQAHRILGICYLSKRMPDKAISEFNKSLKLFPHSVDIYNDLGIAYAMMNNLQEAKKMWLEALKISPEHKNAQNNLNQYN